MSQAADLTHIALPARSSIETLGLAHNHWLTGGMASVMLNRKIIEPMSESWPDWKF
jgi:anaerobic selenocysteine-containing dehydrogenase